MKGLSVDAPKRYWDALIGYWTWVELFINDANFRCAWTYIEHTNFLLLLLIVMKSHLCLGVSCQLVCMENLATLSSRVYVVKGQNRQQACWHVSCLLAKAEEGCKPLAQWQEQEPQGLS